jgi:hypothetical protein
MAVRFFGETGPIVVPSHATTEQGDELVADPKHSEPPSIGEQDAVGERPPKHRAAKKDRHTTHSEAR